MNKEGEEMLIQKHRNEEELIRKYLSATKQNLLVTFLKQEDDYKSKQIKYLKASSLLYSPFEKKKEPKTERIKETKGNQHNKNKNKSLSNFVDYALDSESSRVKRKHDSNEIPYISSRVKSKRQKTAPRRFNKDSNNNTDKKYCFYYKKLLGLAESYRRKPTHRGKIGLIDWKRLLSENIPGITLEETRILGKQLSTQVYIYIYILIFIYIYFSLNFL